jgi:lipopolysaccharide transport system ATP-binding protein
MGDRAIHVDGLGKRYRISHQSQSYGRLTESLSGLLAAPFDRLRGRPRGTSEWFWALRDVSFEVAQGDIVGVVGRNGAGKSTLLKLLSRITEPTTGSARLEGRVGSLLEVGTGFHPELSGRENIYLSGSILGMTRQETARRFDDIVEFAEVEQFLDTPVKRYSSGMAVRLGFAVAAHLETEILIVDEVLAVGDAAFQKKCLAKMGDVAEGGRTILFVSHNMASIESLCRSAILLDRGEIIATGSAEAIVSRYAERVMTLRTRDIATRTDRVGDGRIRVTGIEASVRTGADSSIRLVYEAAQPVRNVDVSLTLFTTRGEGVAILYTVTTGQTFASLPAKGAIVCQIPRASVAPGQYSLNVFCTVGGQIADWVQDASVVEVAEGDYHGTGKLPPPGYGYVLVDHTWQVDRGASARDAH